MLLSHQNRAKVKSKSSSLNQSNSVQYSSSGSKATLATQDLTRPNFRTTYSNTHQSFISLSISVIIYSSICVPGMYLRTIDEKMEKSGQEEPGSHLFIRVLIFSFYVSPIASSFMHLLMAFDR